MVKSEKRIDHLFLIIVIFLVLLGIIILTSVTAAYSYERFGDTYHYLKHQLLFGLLPGLILGYLAYRINLDIVKKKAFHIIIASLTLMVAVFLPYIGLTQNGASRWITLGSYTFQPSELLKLAFIIYLAAWISSRIEKKKLDLSQKTGQMFLPFLFILGIIAVLLKFQSNLSTMIVIAAIGIIMYFLANTPWRHTISIIALGSVAVCALIKFAPYRMDRFLVFLNPDLDPMGKGYQLKQALIAVGSGGLSGKALGLSSQKMGYLPEIISDSVFAVFSEETGFIGCFVLIALFLCFFWRGMEIAKRQQEMFPKLIVIGVITWILIQSFVNIGSMTGLSPLTGIPLPFISYGGSALAIELAAMGLILNISRR